MSYTFLLEQGGESSADSFSAIPRSVRSRLNRIAAKSCCKGKGMGFCPGSRYGMMCGHSTAGRGKKSSTSSAVGSRARISVAPGQRDHAMESMVQGADCGLKCEESLARYDRRSSLWKTVRCSRRGGSTVFSGTLPRWGMMHDGELFRVQTPAWITFEKGFGLWPTPEASLGLIPTYSRRTAEILLAGGDSRKSGAKIGSSLKCEPRLYADWVWNGEKGTIHPRLVESLMDWPTNWTDLKQLGMGRFQSWLRSRGRFFRLK